MKDKPAPFNYNLLLEQANNDTSPIIATYTVRWQILDRFFNQYFPALCRSSRNRDVERVWESFRYYITVPFTGRKPFQLSSAEADSVIAVLARLCRSNPKIDG